MTQPSKTITLDLTPEELELILAAMRAAQYPWEMIDRAVALKAKLEEAAKKNA